MGKFVFANMANSKLAAGISTTDTLLQVSNTQGNRFPDPSGGDEFRAVIYDSTGYFEIIGVKARQDDVFTDVQRGLEGTVARSWAADAQVSLRPTQEVYESFDQNLDHNDLPNRDADDAHPISSITSLSSALGTLTSNTTTNANSITNHKLDKANPHEVTAAQVGAASSQDVQDVADGLSTHEGLTNNPHEVTAAQVGAEPADSTILKEADIHDTPVSGATDNPVSSNALFEHENDTANPHSVTAAQIGAATTSALSSHTGDTSNPHSVTAAQVGAPTTTDLSNHTGDTDNPHAVTAAQIGAATTTDLSTHTGDTDNPHAVTAAQVGAATTSDLSTHTGDTSNPHAVTAAQAGADPSGTAASAISSHEGSYDHHTDPSSDGNTYGMKDGDWALIPGANIIEYGVVVSGTGDVQTDINAMDFTGHPYAGSNTYISVEVNHVPTISHDGSVYKYVGAKPVDLGTGGDTTVASDFVSIGSSDHSALSNRDATASHPTSAIDHSGTALSSKITAYDSHVGSSSNPHSVTAAQVGAPTTAAFSAHTGNTNNPHVVTAAQVGAATTGDLSSHTGDTNNPHSVTAAQVGAATTGALSSHTGDTDNPHSVTAAQVGAATTGALSSHTDDTNNPHNVTASQVGAEPADSTLLRTTDVDDEPVNGATTAPISSNYMFDHEASTDAHGTAYIKASASNATLTSADDLATIKTAGHYRWSSSSVPVSAPVAASYGLMIVDRDGGNWRQIVITSGILTTKARLFMRRADSGVYGEWTEFLNTDHITDTAAHAASKISVDSAALSYAYFTMDDVQAQLVQSVGRLKTVDASLTAHLDSGTDSNPHTGSLANFEDDEMLGHLSIRKNDAPQLLVTGGSNTGQDGGIELRGRRNGDTSPDTANLLFTNYDNDDYVDSEESAVFQLGLIGVGMEDAGSHEGHLSIQVASAENVLTERLHISSDGEIEVNGTINQSAGGLNVLTGDTLIDSSADALRISGGDSDHVFIEFFARQNDVVNRSAWMGYGSSGTDILSIYNDLGDTRLAVSEGNDVYFDVGGTVPLRIDKDFVDIVTGAELTFETQKHSISANDGNGNFNLRVANSAAELCTEAGYAFHDEWHQLNGWRHFKISDVSLSLGNVIKWRTQIKYDADDVELAYQGDVKLATTSSGATVTGTLNATTGLQEAGTALSSLYQGIIGSGDEAPSDANGDDGDLYVQYGV